VEIDGQRLDTDVQLLFRLRRLLPQPSLRALTVDEARADMARTARTFEGPKIPVEDVASLEIPGPAGAIRARRYLPEDERGRLPLLVYLHGGGWVRGDLDTHDNVCRFLAREAGVAVLSVDYRLAPEHPFPAPVDDALAAFRYAAGHATELGADPAAVALGGDSAGGNLTAAVSMLAARDGGPVPAFAVMIYPATDFSRKRRSCELFGDGFFLTEEEMDWYRGHYLRDESSALDPRASPLLEEDLSDFPPCYITTAGFDVLRDEGEEYARRLREAAVAVALRRHPGMIHGFAHAIAVPSFGREAMLEVAGALRVGVARAAVRPRVA
jgi:acetyl esterase